MQCAAGPARRGNAMHSDLRGYSPRFEPLLIVGGYGAHLGTLDCTLNTQRRAQLTIVSGVAPTFTFIYKTPLKKRVRLRVRSVQPSAARLFLACPTDGIKPEPGRP